MRICFLADAGTTNTFSYIQHFRQKGHEVVCITLHPPTSDFEGTEVVHLKASAKWEYGLRLPRVRRLVRRLRPDILVGYRLTSYGLLAVLAGLRPVVVTTTGFDLLWRPSWTAFLRRALVRFVVSRADLVVSWAPHLTSALPRPLAPERILTQPRGIDLSVFKPGPIRPAARPPVVVSTRSLKTWYRVDVLIRAFAVVLKRVPDASLSIIGDGPERKSLESLAASLGIGSRVCFHGRLRLEEVAAHLQRARVCASQIEFDGVSASLLEAMATGALPVVTDNPANRHWVSHGHNGLLVLYGDGGALVRALERGLEDPDFREGAHQINLGRVRAEGDRSRNMDLIEERFRRLAERSRTPAPSTA